MKRTNAAFTVVEIVVIIAVIGLLAAIATVGLSIYQSDARDAQRAANATTLTEALEKYYTENGEYPSVPSITNTPSNTASGVATKLGVNQEALTMPQSSQPLALTHPDQDADHEDAIHYVGESTVNNQNCQEAVNGGCDRYTLSYTKDDGEEVVLESRYNATARATASVAPERPDMSAGSGGGLVITATLSDPNCADNATRLTAKYGFQHRVNDGAWTAVTWQTGSSFNVNGVQGSSYDFQGFTRCDDGATVGLQSPLSNMDTHTIPLNAPSAPSTSVALSGSNVVATASVVTCPSGSSPQYSIRGRTNNGTWGAYSTWSTTRTASQAAAQGVRYGYQSQARCQNAETTSGAAAGTEGAYVHPVNAPGAPSVSPRTSGTATSYDLGNTSCASGTNPRWQYRQVRENFTSGWYGPYTTKPTPTWTTSSQGYNYTAQVQVQCYNGNASSGWSGVGQGTYYRGVGNPSNTGWNAWRGDGATVYLSANTTCGAGVYPDQKVDIHTWNWSWSPYPPEKLGWYRNHFGSWVLNDLTYRGETVTSGSRSNRGNIPNGYGWNIAVEKRCRNHTTGHASGVFYQESGRYNL